MVDGYRNHGDLRGGNLWTQDSDNSLSPRIHDSRSIPWGTTVRREWCPGVSRFEV